MRTNGCNCIDYLYASRKVEDLKDELSDLRQYCSDIEQYVSEVDAIEITAKVLSLWYIDNANNPDVYIDKNLRKLLAKLTSVVMPVVM